MVDTNQTKVMNTLKGKAKSTSEIAFLTKLNYYVVSEQLDKLFKDRKVIKVERNRGTFWEKA